MTPLTEPVGLSMTREDTSPGQSCRFEKPACHCAN